MTPKKLAALALFAAMAVPVFPATAPAQPVCPPGFVFTPGGCRPAPPPRYAPPPVYAPPPGPAYDPNIKQVASPYVTLHTCAGDRCPPAGTIPRGTPVRIMGWEGPFVWVHVPGSPLEGWVKRRHLTP